MLRSLWLLVLVTVCLLKTGIIPAVTVYLMPTSGDLISTNNDWKKWHLIVAGVTISISTFMEVVDECQYILDGGIINISRSIFSISSTTFAMFMAYRCKEQRTFYVSYLVSIGIILTVFIATMGILGAKKGILIEK